MRYRRLFKWAAAMLAFCISLPVLAQPETVEPARSEFNKLILANPNYFVTVNPMKFNVKYEELVSVGLLPEQDLLKAIVNVKLAYGYGGSLCTAGSVEYVRFFIDWNGNSSFSDANEDLGVARVNVHDIPSKPYTCLLNALDSKPMSFTLTQKINSLKKPCIQENVVRVKAILAWNTEPAAGNPNYVPVWGNVLESWVQIKPSWTIQVAPMDSIEWTEQIVDPGLIYEKAIPSFKETVSVTELKTAYQGKNIPEIRYNFSEIDAKAAEVKINPALRNTYRQNPQMLTLVKNIDLVLQQKFNTDYEQLKRVGYDYDQSRVSAVLTVKKPYGYCGTLCKKGSMEYVAFWAYVHDQIEQMCHWKYLGMAAVNVHDILSIPAAGLQYAVYMPVDFSTLQDECGKPQVLKIRALLSWNKPLSAADVNTVPAWGNRIEAKIQLRPQKPNTTGKPTPYLWSLGHMPVENISGNSYTIIGSSLGDGYANGLSTDGWTALESPFGGSITISGEIAGMPDISSGASKLKYKVQYKKSSDPAWQDIVNTFTIYRRINGVPAGYMNQIAVSGYYTYEKDLTPPVWIEVQDDVLAQFYTPVSKGDGLYSIRILVQQPGAPPMPDVPAGHVASSIVKIVLDNTIPKPVSLKMDAGPCMVYQPGDSITGKFTALDKHFRAYSFSLLPYSFPAGSFSHVPAASTYPALPGSGVPLGTFTLRTGSMAPCGYVLELDVSDRTIVNNYPNGNWNSASVGFCLLKR